MLRLRTGNLKLANFTVSIIEILRADNESSC